MSISKSYNKQNGVTYVYEVLENRWDKEKKRPQSKRKLIGKIDPETNEIIPTSRKQKRVANHATDYKNLYAESVKTAKIKETAISDLKKTLIDVLTDQIAFYSEVELSAQRKKKEAEGLLCRYKNHD